MHPKRHGRPLVRYGTFLLVASLVAVLQFGSGCQNSFNPKGPYEEQLVVYSVLSTRSDTQYVRVYATYNPPGFDPLENTNDTFVRNATVTLADGSNQYVLRDTTISRVDPSRYGEHVAAYVGYPIPLRTAVTYTLSVRSDRGIVTARTSVPGAGRVSANNAYVIREPTRYQEDISATIYMSPITLGYFARLFLNFETLSGSTWTLRRVEVPSSVQMQGDGSVTFRYPRLTRRRTDIILPNQTIYFSLAAYQSFLSQLLQQYGAARVRLVSATFVLTQVESSLYKYYNIVNGFRDEYSIRTDQPDYTNIQGGIGLFGAMTEDSTIADLQ